MQIRRGKPSGWGRLSKTGVELSREARVRLAWMDLYQRCGKVAHTCRHFGISRQTFYRWLKRYEPVDLTMLEQRSHCPRRRRQPTWSFSLEGKVLTLRLQFPRWGKDKLAVLHAPPGGAGFNLHGGTHSHATQTAGPAGRAAPHGSATIATRAAVSFLCGAQTQAVCGFGAR